MAKYEYDGIWPVIHIDKWERFEAEVTGKQYRNWIFRGMSNVSWKLESSLYRIFADIQNIIVASSGKPRKFSRIRHERQILRQFKEHAHLYFETLPTGDNDLEWLCLMQHYGTQTRLLDMTFSPYIAAFFALEAGHDDCCVYAIRHQFFTKLDQDVLGQDYRETSVFTDRRGGKSYFFPYEPELKDERIVAQQGLFLVSSNNYESYDQIMKIYHAKQSIRDCVKYILPKSIRYEGLKKLRAMNISRATLFPGIDGFCQSIKFQVLENVKSLQRLQ